MEVDCFARLRFRRVRRVFGRPKMNGQQMLVFGFVDWLANAVRPQIVDGAFAAVALGLPTRAAVQLFAGDGIAWRAIPKFCRYPRAAAHETDAIKAGNRHIDARCGVHCGANNASPTIITNMSPSRPSVSVTISRITGLRAVGAR